MKATQLLVAIFILATCTLVYLDHQKRNNNEQLLNKFEAIAQTNQQLTLTVEQLETELSVNQKSLLANQQLIAQLEQQLIDNQTIVASTEPAVSNELILELPAAIDTAPSREDEEITSTEKFFALAEKMRKNGAGFTDDLAQNFADQDRDDEWASEYEANILEMIANDEQHNFQVESVNCKSSMCELSVFANESSVLSLGTNFSKVIGEQQWRDKNATVFFNHEIKDGTMKFFVGRTANSFN